MYPDEGVYMYPDEGDYMYPDEGDYMYPNQAVERGERGEEEESTITLGLGSLSASDSPEGYMASNALTVPIQKTDGNPVGVLHFLNKVGSKNRFDLADIRMAQVAGRLMGQANFVSGAGP